MTLPLRCGIHYRQQTPAEARGKWRFLLLRDARCPLAWRVPDTAYHDATGREWMRHEAGYRIIRAGYTWNGCSPKRRVPILGWVGTPDTPRNVWASLVHDAGYQFSGTAHWHLSREMEDLIFLANLRLCRFPLAAAYHGAVRDFGAAFWGKNPEALQSHPIPPPIP